jgi:hypothetical protein
MFWLGGQRFTRSLMPVTLVAWLFGHVFRARRDAIRIGSHHVPTNQIQPRGVAIHSEASIRVCINNFTTFSHTLGPVETVGAPGVRVAGTQLLSHEEMGDLKASQFLRHLRWLAADVTDDFLHPIWTSRLPLHVQAKLVGRIDCSLDVTAHVADEFWDIPSLSLRVSHLQPPTLPGSWRPCRNCRGRLPH